MDADVIVIGAGMAGLTAERELSGAGLKVVLVEARDRMGGRVHTVRDERFPLPVEVGAEFVHGRPPALMGALQRAGIWREDVTEEHWWFDGKRLRKSEDFEEEMEPAFKGMGRKDVTFREHLAELPETKRVRKAKPMALMYVEGLDAGDASEVGTRWRAGQAKASEEIGAEVLYRPAGGYEGLVGAYAPKDLRLGWEVTGIEWGRGKVEVRGVKVMGGRAAEAARGRAGRGETPPRPAAVREVSLRARAVVVTLPLGVLSVARGMFEPGLPEGVMRALSTLRPAPVVRAVVSFDSAFWEKGFPTAGKLDPSTLGFVHSRGLAFPTVWTARPKHVPVMTCWAGGPAADAISGLSDKEIEGVAVRSTATMLGLTAARVRKHVRGCVVGNWQADPYARGAYTYGTVGAVEAWKVLQKPVEGTVFLAGEHTYEGLVGTVDAAIASGERAAKQVVRGVKRR